jgi:hypothetical protein
MSYGQVDADVWRMDLSEEFNLPLTFLPDPLFDSAVVGIAHEGVVIYDAQKVVDIVAKRDNLNKEAAHAYADMNIFTDYSMTSPMFFWPVVKPPGLQQ